MVDLPAILDGEDKSSPLANRIRKNYRHIRKWAKRTETDCFRLYDKEIKEYPVAIDFYAGKFCIHYFSRDKDENILPAELEYAVVNALFSVLGAHKSDIFWRTRSRSKETRQYEKLGMAKDFFYVSEYGLKFKVNLVDYVDTGLFLDHRETRRLVGASSQGKRVLNLFAYTCAFSIHAAKGGAVFTKSVDMSNTYTAWGRDNFTLNGLAPDSHPIIRADCLKFLDEEIASGDKYDTIIIDPPTISRSKKMDQLFDVQVDYIALITKALKLLASQGIIFFSTNLRKFAFDRERFPGCLIKEISAKTIPMDFHDPKIHRCWTIMSL